METPPQDAHSAFPPSTGLALASLLLGIAAVGLSFLVIGSLIGAVGIILGIVYLNRERGPKGMARWGISLSVLGIFASIGFAALYYYFFHKMQSSFAGGGVVTTTTGALANAGPLTNSNPLLKSNLVWSATIFGAQALCVGDWESDGTARVLVAAGRTLHVLDLTGAEKSTLKLPAQFTGIECGRNKTSGARLLGFSANDVSVIDHAGKTAWGESALMGMNGAHWGDLNGDGNDVMVIGMNGFGGLEVLSSEGKKLWSVSLVNVWSQAIIPATTNHPALVLADDGTGAVDVFDAAGQQLNSLRANGGFYMQMAAGLTESNQVQILAVSANAIEAFDQAGKTAWATSALPSLGQPHPVAVLGDFKGDGTKQWAFVDGAGDLVVATTSGLKVSSIPKQSLLQGLAFAPRPGQGGLLLTLNGGVVRAHSFGP